MSKMSLAYAVNLRYHWIARNEKPKYCLQHCAANYHFYKSVEISLAQCEQMFYNNDCRMYRKDVVGMTKEQKQSVELAHKDYEDLMSSVVDLLGKLTDRELLLTYRFIRSLLSHN